MYEFQVQRFQPFSSWTVDVLEHELGNCEGILGMDFIGTLEEWMSAKNKKLHLHGGMDSFLENIRLLNPPSQ